MSDYIPIHVDGARVVSAGGEAIDVINPATEQPAGQIALGSPTPWPSLPRIAIGSIRINPSRSDGRILRPSVVRSMTMSLARARRQDGHLVGRGRHTSHRKRGAGRLLFDIGRPHDLNGTLMLSGAGASTAELPSTDRARLWFSLS